MRLAHHWEPVPFSIQGTHWISSVTPLPAPEVFPPRDSRACPVARAPVWNLTQPREQLTRAPDGFDDPVTADGWAALCLSLWTRRRPFLLLLITHFLSSTAGSWKQLLSTSKTHHCIKFFPALSLNSAIMLKTIQDWVGNARGLVKRENLAFSVSVNLPYSCHSVPSLWHFLPQFWNLRFRAILKTSVII